MRWLVFPQDTNFSLSSLRFSLMINLDLADHILLKPKEVRIYKVGGYEEYEIRNVIKLEEDVYYIVGKQIKEVAV